MVTPLLYTYLVNGNTTNRPIHFTNEDKKQGDKEEGYFLLPLFSGCSEYFIIVPYEQIIQSLCKSY